MHMVVWALECPPLKGAGEALSCLDEFGGVSVDVPCPMPLVAEEEFELLVGLGGSYQKSRAALALPVVLACHDAVEVQLALGPPVDGEGRPQAGFGVGVRVEGQGSLFGEVPCEDGLKVHRHYFMRIIASREHNYWTEGINLRRTLKT